MSAVTVADSTGLNRRRRRVPMALVGMLVVFSALSAVDSVVWSRTPDLFVAQSGVIDPRHYGGPWAESGIPVHSVVGRWWFGTVLASTQLNPQALHVLTVQLIAQPGVAAPELEHWEMVNTPGATYSLTNPSGRGWPPYSLPQDHWRFAVVRPVFGLYSMARFRIFGRPQAKITLVIGVRAPRGRRNFGYFGVALTYRDADGSVHSQSIPEGVEICSAGPSAPAPRVTVVPCGLGTP
jgi:hypothetical protein